jgi:hypothetical protein
MYLLVPRRETLTALAAGLALLAGACARHPAPPVPGAANSAAPSLFGRPVMVLPVQPTSGPGITAVPGLDADIAYFLPERAPGVHWILPAELEKALRNAPTLRIRPRELEVGAFRRARLERIGEPLFTDLHNLGLLLNARLALLPYAAGYIAGSGSEPGRVEVQVAIIDTSDGDVLWIGAAAGQPASPSSAAASASAASALAELVGR